MNNKDIIVDSFLNVNIGQLCRVPIIAVYKHPKDYPGKYVARLWDVNKKATNYIIVKPSLEMVQSNIPPGMVRPPPFVEDDPILIETWV